MRPFYKPTTRALLCGAAACVALPAMPGTIELLPLGDSITFGVGSDTDGLASNPSPDDDLGGFRFYLDGLLNPDFDFVGNRSVGSGTSGFVDNQNFGVRGGEASVDATGEPSTLTGINAAGPGVTSVDAAFNSSVANPDAALVRIGINSLPKNSFVTGSSFGSAGARLINDVDLAVGQFATLLDGDGSRPNGLVSRVIDTNFFDANGHLFVALITPRVDGDTSNPSSSNQQFINRKQGVTTAMYNNGIKAELESRMGPGGDLENRVTFVDLFSISLAELDLQALADEFFSGDLVALNAAINPDATDAYVDWIGVEFDEGRFDNGAFDINNDWGEDLLTGDSNTGNLINANTALLGDGLHPTNLGYAIEAQVWANAINTHYAIPEPSAMLLMFGGGLLLSGRRRKTA